VYFLLSQRLCQKKIQKKGKRVKAGMETGEKGEMPLISTLSPVSIPA
jgi:hypothetical protein